MVLTARLRTAEPNAATGYELDAIAATVMGGTSLFGGEGTVVGTVIGALIIATLRNGLNLMNVVASLTSNLPSDSSLSWRSRLTGSANSGRSAARSRQGRVRRGPPVANGLPLDR